MNIIVITGASSGIGKATAKLFAEKGWTVVAIMRTPEKETELTAYENVHLFPLDITNPKQVRDTSAEILKTFDVDVLFNNAGYGMKARFEDMDEELMKKSINTNMLGMVRVTQAYIPHFKKKRAGLILTTTSLAGEMGLVLDGVYSADKWVTMHSVDIIRTCFWEHLNKFQFRKENAMYAQAAIKPNTLLRNGAYGIVMRGVQKCTRGCSSLRDRKRLPLCCIKLDTATESKVQSMIQFSDCLAA